jgi:hypothetical protein
MAKGRGATRRNGGKQNLELKVFEPLNAALFEPLIGVAI